MSADIVNVVFGTVTVFAQVAAIMMLFFLVSGQYKPLASFFDRYGIFIAFLVSLVAVVGSLIYSEGLGYEPCLLCWFQRIFMYPLVLLTITALAKSDHFGVIDYALTLSVPGTMLALYHYLLQIGATSYAPCDALGYSVSCSKVFTMTFGYITIPLMAFSAFLLITMTLFLVKKSRTFLRT